MSETVPSSNDEATTNSKVAVSHFPIVDYWWKENESSNQVEKPADWWKENGSSDQAGKPAEPMLVNDTHSRIKIGTSLSELIHRMEQHDADEKSRIAADKHRRLTEQQKRVIDTFTTKANILAFEHAKRRELLFQQIANGEYLLAQETVSALLQITPDDIELQKAQQFFDTRYDTIGAIRSLAVGGAVNSLALLPDGKQMLVGLVDKRVLLCDLVAGVIVKGFSGHTNQVTGVDVLPQGDLVVTAGLDRTVRLFSTDASVAPVSWSCKGAVRSVRALPDGKVLATCGDDTAITLWDIESKTAIGNFTGHDSEVLTIDYSPDAEFLLSGSRAKTLKLWEIQANREVRSLFVLQGEVRCVRFFPGIGHRFAVSTHADGTIRVWDTQTGREIGRWEGHEGPVNCVAFMPDGRHAVTGGADKTVRVWDVMSGREVRAFVGHTAPIVCIGTTADGQFAVSGSQDNTIRIWGTGV